MIVKEIKLGILIAALCGLGSVGIAFAYNYVSGTAPLLLVMVLIVVSALVLEVAASPRKRSQVTLAARAQDSGAMAAAAEVWANGLAAEPAPLGWLGNDPIVNPMAGIANQQTVVR
jgi:hypothetical protein